jgi:urease accessory protein
MPRPTAREIRRGPLDGAAADRVVLDYEGRFLRRRLLTTATGAELLVDLPETVSLDDGDAFVTETGALIAVTAAPEPLIEVTAPPHDLARLAWHIGNRHMPAAIAPHRILIRADHVMADSAPPPAPSPSPSRPSAAPTAPAAPTATTTAARPTTPTRGTITRMITGSITPTITAIRILSDGPDTMEREGSADTSQKQNSTKKMPPK